MRTLLLCLLSFFILLQSCSNNGGNKIPERIAFKQNPMDSVYSKLRPALQFFTIDNTKATVIKAANGTQVLVPANCFVNRNGDAAGNVQLEVVEAFSLQDFVTSGLATVSGDKLLISNGMMYVNARSGDEPLQLSKGAALTVSMPTMGNGNDGFQMFTGDGSNWTADSTMMAMDYTIPLPLDLLYPKGNKFFWNCINNAGDPNERYAVMDTSIVTVTNKKYENTVIATPDFQWRYYALREMMERMSYFVNRDYYFDKVDCMNRTYDQGIFNIYFEHPERSFRESDSIAKKMYIDYFAANEQKIAAFCEEVNQHKRTYYSNWTDTNYYFDFRKTSLKDDYMSVLEYFPPRNSREIKHINDHGVNLDTANAFELLKQKGVPVAEINDLLSYAFRRRSMIQQLQSAKDAAANQAKLSKTYESTVFSVTTMGWINCDRFYDDPTAGKAAMYVSNSSGKYLDFIDCSLVIPDMNVRLTGFPDNTGTYSFTQKDGRYTKLPIGRAAVIVGVSMQHDSLFFASKKINIADGLKISLPMGYTTVKGLKDSLAVALK